MKVAYKTMSINNVTDEELEYLGNRFTDEDIMERFDIGFNNYLYLWQNDNSNEIFNEVE